MANKLRVFVASSSEQLPIVKEIAGIIGQTRRIEAKPWTEKVFEYSKTYIESLESELDRADFAIVVLTADDVGNVRKKSVNLPRDNVIFELGLFSGRLGRDRCFFFVEAASQTRLASDLSGIHHAVFRGQEHPDHEHTMALRDCVTDVTLQMRRLGPRSKPSPQVRKEREELWNFSSTFAEHWWERIKEGEDSSSALSYVTISVDELTNTPKFVGRTFNLHGDRMADWESVTSGVVLPGRGPTRRPEAQVFYRWSGANFDARGQEYGGHGVVTLQTSNADVGEGYFIDTNFAVIGQGIATTIKHFRMYRCTQSDRKIMKNPTSEAARALRAERLTSLRGMA